MSKGIVVDHKESGVRYAISEHNFNEKVHELVRDLKPGETILGFKPKVKSQSVDEPPASVAYSQTDLDEVVEGYSLEELKDLAKEEGLPVSGTKADLAASLLTAGAFAASDD